MAAYLLAMASNLIAMASMIQLPGQEAMELWTFSNVGALAHMEGPTPRWAADPRQVHSIKASPFWKSNPIQWSFSHHFSSFLSCNSLSHPFSHVVSSLFC